jgi:hypothetical protein
MIRADDLEILSQHPAAVEALVEGLKRQGARRFEVRVNVGPGMTTAELVDNGRVDRFFGRKPKAKTA